MAMDEKRYMQQKLKLVWIAADESLKGVPLQNRKLTDHNFAMVFLV